MWAEANELLRACSKLEDANLTRFTGSFRSRAETLRSFTEVGRMPDFIKTVKSLLEEDLNVIVTATLPIQPAREEPVSAEPSISEPFGNEDGGNEDGSSGMRAEEPTGNEAGGSGMRAEATVDNEPPTRAPQLPGNNKSTAGKRKLSSSRGQTRREASKLRLEAGTIFNATKMFDEAPFFDSLWDHSSYNYTRFCCFVGVGCKLLLAEGDHPSFLHSFSLEGAVRFAAAELRYDAAATEKDRRFKIFTQGVRLNTLEDLLRPYFLQLSGGVIDWLAHLDPDKATDV
ncbi:hypothetical protein CYMTET_34616, partial [Cymbomonas tetramitiformis]